MSEWKKVSMSKLGSFARGRGGPRSDEVNDGVPCVKYGDIYTFHGEIIRSFCSYIAPERAHSYTRLSYGDVVIAASGETVEEIGKATAYIGSGEAFAGGDTILFKPNQSLLNSAFAGYALNSDRALRHRSRMGQGSSVIHISGGNLSSLEILLPPLPQQRRIAEILSTVDEAIEQTERLIAKQQQIKAGLMQDLFTRGVWTAASIERARASGSFAAASAKVGQLRPPREIAPELYKESPLGWIPKDWEVKKCYDISQRICVGIVIRPTQYYQSSGVPAFRSANVRESGITLDDLVYISDTSNALLAKSQVKGGDILTVRTGYAWAMEQALMVGFVRDGFDFDKNLVPVLFDSHLNYGLGEPTVLEYVHQKGNCSSLDGFTLHRTIHRRRFNWSNGCPATNIALYHSWHLC